MARGHRGKSRGGRGGFSKRGGRGGGRGRRGRGNGDGFKSGKSKGTSNNHDFEGSESQEAHYRRQFTQLMDLDVDVHAPALNSMKALSRRPGKRQRDKENFSFYRAADFTTQHIDVTMNKPLRRYHIEFVKASELYDPSSELIKKLSQIELKTENESVSKEEIEGELELISTNNEFVDQEIAEITETLPETLPETEKEGEEETQELYAIKEIPETSQNIEDGSSENEGEDDQQEDSVEVEDIVTELVNDNDDEDEAHSDASQLEVRVGKFVAEPEIDSDGDMFISLPRTSKRSKKLQFIREKEIEYDEYKLDNEDSSEEDDEDDYYKESIRDYISNVMKNTLRRNSDSESGSSSEDEDNSDYDSESDVDMPSLNDQVEPIYEPVEEIEEIQDNDDPEFGFLPEDYEAFDVSRISVSGVRKGAENVLYETTSTLFFGDSESRWISKDEFIDLTTDNGLPEHRIPQFMKFILNGIDDEYNDSEEEESEEESDLEFITDGEDSNSDSEMGIDEDDLKHMAAFANSRQFDPLEVNTKSLKTKGKGKKSELVLTDDLEMRQELMNQFLFRNSSKRDKRNAKHDDRKALEELDSSLLIKYPYEMWIKEIISEVKSFYKDNERVALRFPPLDPHGGKTIKKIADCYHMQHRKLGNGQKTFIVVIKNKKTYRSSPDYGKVDRLIKQRPYFKRTDVKKPKDLIEKEKNLKKKGKSSSSTSSAGKYSEGALVAQDAPEISHDNIGRKLLEKMGWQKGNSLGVGNEGIIEPIQAKIKKSKAGINLSKDIIV